MGRWSDRLPGLAAVGIATTVLAIVQLRLSRGGIQAYGYDGAQFIEHRDRLLAWRALQGAGETGWLEAIRHADKDYPPLLHVLTSILVAPFEHASLCATRTGSLWFLALAAAVGGIAWLVERKRSTAAAAFVGCLLVPGLHGAATRYYYDLPFVTILWLMLLLGLWTAGRRSIVGGVGVGLLWFLACLVKWTAIPLGAVAALAVLVGPGRASRSERGVALAVTGVTALLLVIGWLTLLGGPGSLGGMLGNYVGTLQPPDAGQPSGLVGLIGAAGRAIASVDPFARLQFYGLGLFFAAFSPLLALSALSLCALWLMRGRAAWPAIAVMGGGQLAFATLWVAVFDERFVLGVAPAIVLGAALGWSRCGPRARSIVGVGVVLAGLVVASEFHLGVPHVSTGFQRIENRMPDSFPNITRGVWAADSVERRGWGRWDGEDRSDARRRAALWDVIEREDPDIVLVDGEPDLGTAVLESAWLDYRVLQHAAVGGPEPLVRYDGDCSGADLIVTIVEGDDEPVAPLCGEADWTEVATLPRPAGESKAAFWLRGDEAGSQ